MILRFWTCPECLAPMERTMRSRDYWQCRFCEHEMDGWYPEKGANEVIVDEETHKRGPYTVMLDQALDYPRVLVEGPGAKRASGETHVFDSPAARDALQG